MHIYMYDIYIISIYTYVYLSCKYMHIYMHSHI